MNTLASPGLQAIEPIATAEVVNGQMSWAKLYKTSSWHQVKTVLLLSLEKDNLALLQQGEVLEQEIYNDLDTVLLIHQWPQTPAQKPTPHKAKQNSSLFFRFFRFFHFFFAFASIFSLNFRLFYLRFRFRFLVFRIEVNHVKSGFFFASKRNEIFASISNFASEAKVRAHPMPHPVFCKLGSIDLDTVFRFRIHRIQMFLGLPDPNPLVRGIDPDPDPSIIKQK